MTTACIIQDVATNRPEVYVCVEEQHDRTPAERAGNCRAVVNIWLLSI